MKKLNNTILMSLAIALCVTIAMPAAAQKKGGKKPATNTTKNSKPTENSKNTTTTEKKTEEKPAVQDNPGTLKNHGFEIQKVVKNENGVIRGYDFGTTKQKIRETEDAKYIADGKDFIIYEVVINDKEKAEIIYYLDENEKVKGFGVAFLVTATMLAENVEATLVDDFQNYFNERYGKFVSNEKGDEVWTSKDGSYTVEMGDSSEDSSTLEIEIEIFKK